MMRALAAGLLVLACCKGDAPAPGSASAVPAPGSASAVPAAAFGVVAEIRGPATLVAGTRRFALRVGERGWYESRRGALVEDPAAGAAIADAIAALGGVVDVFLGRTPIVVGGEEHHARHVRITPARVEVPAVGVATKIANRRDGLEIWAYEHELRKDVLLFDDDDFVAPRAHDRIGPLPESMSPVSARLCAQPRVDDVAASDRAVFALVTECGELAPLRIATYVDDRAPPTVTTLPARRTLGLAGEKLAVSPAGTVHLAGIRDGRFAIAHVVGTTTVPEVFGPATRVLAAVAGADDTVWALVLDDASKPAVVRGGVPVALGAGHTATALGFDETFGVVVLAAGTNATWLYAERPGTPVVITPAR